ncbi:MAG: prepilin-type N-terminal cleavage/methylation domain-containing protein [Candidatus Pacebacteria bacterium]|nr:prepilin-type N-terminal cleavage/methylation domain-containing protein [Candidatus Paceibacterota bacterium]
MKNNSIKHSKGFTLLEMVVVTGIIALLSSIIYTNFSKDSQYEAHLTKAKAFSVSIPLSLPTAFVSEWKFDGPTAAGGNATTDDVKDTWGSADGVISAIPPIVRAGGDCISGKCLEFDGASSYVDITTVSDLNTISTGTISLWFKWKTGTYNSLFVLSNGSDKWTTVGLGDWTGSYTDESLAYYFYDSSSVIAAYQRKGSDYYKDSRWHYLVLTAGTNYNKIYIDGEQVVDLIYIAGSSSTGGYFLNNPAFNTFSIGSRYLSSRDGYLGGMIDEVHVYKEALIADQMEAEYLAGLDSLYGTKGISLGEYQQRRSLMAFN